METLTYRVVTLPTLGKDAQQDPQALALAMKMRDFRLHALQTSPEAFATSVEQARKHGIDHTIERLSNPKAAHFVAIANQFQSEKDPGYMSSLDGIANSTWLGIIVILGPENGRSSSAVSAHADPFTRMTEERNTGTDTGISELHYHLNMVFVDLAARRLGVGKALIDAALGKAAKDARSAGASVKATILVNVENDSARKLYEKGGFVVVGEDSYMQPPRGLVEGETRPQERKVFCLEYFRDVSQLSAVGDD